MQESNPSLPENGTIAYVDHLPECDVCRDENDRPGVTAIYLVLTRRYVWMYVCRAHFSKHAIGGPSPSSPGALGVGRGQRLIPRPEAISVTSPDVDDGLTPEERLLHAIFGNPPRDTDGKEF